MSALQLGVNGSPFIDIGLTFSGDFTVNGNPVQAEDQVPEALNPEEAAPKLQQLHQLCNTRQRYVWGGYRTSGYRA